MRLKEGFILRQVAGSWVAVATGPTCVDFNGMLTLNDTGALLWRVLERGGGQAELLAALTDSYQVEPEQASQDIRAFLDTLRQAGCLMD